VRRIQAYKQQCNNQTSALHCRRRVQTLNLLLES
jgi:hypothetical protein